MDYIETSKKEYYLYSEPMEKAVVALRKEKAGDGVVRLQLQLDFDDYAPLLRSRVFWFSLCHCLDWFIYHIENRSCNSNVGERSPAIFQDVWRGEGYRVVLVLSLAQD